MLIPKQKNVLKKVQAAKVAADEAAKKKIYKSAIEQMNDGTERGFKKL